MPHPSNGLRGGRHNGLRWRLQLQELQFVVLKEKHRNLAESRRAKIARLARVRGHSVGEALRIGDLDHKRGDRELQSLEERLAC